MFDRIVSAVREFEASLTAEQETGLMCTYAGGGELVRVRDVGYHNPYLMKVYGELANGAKCVLLQHMNAFSLLLVAVPAAAKPARRIGFQHEDAAEPESGNG